MLFLVAPAWGARGVSPYLPLNISPEIERHIERLMVIAGEPVMKRPLPAATVLDALETACGRDPVACSEVRRYLQGFMKNYGLSFASIEVSTTDSTRTALPNRHGISLQSQYEVAAQSYWQPGDNLLISGGFVASEGQFVPTGTVVSFGNEYLQIDAGFRDRWLSPLTMSTMLLGTQAATMPSIGISNYRPLTRFNLRYEFFVSEMSFSERIRYGDGLTAGNPKLAGMHMSIEPFSGWSLGVNRILQYGGGERSDDFNDLINGFFLPNKFDNTGTSQELGNQAASITARYVHSGDQPFAVYFEYAGEDTSTNSNARLGNVGLLAGIHLPALHPRLDLSIEFGEWQNAWYVNSNYGDGLRHEGNVLGHWGADWRESQDAVGARSLMSRMSWTLRPGSVIESSLYLLDNESYSAPSYEQSHMAELRYSRKHGELYGGVSLQLGKNSFGESYSRLAIFMRY